MVSPLSCSVWRSRARSSPRTATHGTRGTPHPSVRYSVGSSLSGASGAVTGAEGVPQHLGALLVGVPSGHVLAAGGHLPQPRSLTLPRCREVQQFGPRSLCPPVGIRGGEGGAERVGDLLHGPRRDHVQETSHFGDLVDCGLCCF